MKCIFINSYRDLCKQAHSKEVSFNYSCFCLKTVACSGSTALLSAAVLLAISLWTAALLVIRPPKCLYMVVMCIVRLMAGRSI